MAGREGLAMRRTLFECMLKLEGAIVTIDAMETFLRFCLPGQHTSVVMECKLSSSTSTPRPGPVGT